MAAHTKGQHISTRARLKGSPSLSQGAAAIFAATVAAVDAAHFSAVDLPLLEQYAGAADLARQAQRHLDKDGR